MTNCSIGKLLLTAAVSVAAIAGQVQSAGAREIKIGLIAPLSGPIASQGVPTSKGFEAAQKYKPSVNGHDISYIILDDGSDPSQSARNARKLIEEDKVDVIVGTGGVPGSMALAAIASEAKVPLVSYTPLFVSGDKAEWSVTTAQPTDLMLTAIVDDMVKNDVKTVGYIGFADSWGDLAYKTLKQLSDPRGIEIVTDERYARSDTSVTGQALKVVAANPDAVLGGTAGTPGALVNLALADRGYDGLIYGTHGIINPDFIRVAGDSAEGMLAPTGPVMVADQLPDDHPSKKIALDYIDAYKSVYGKKPDEAFSAYAFDAWLVIADAASRVPADIEPGTQEYRTALRDAIFQTKKLPVTHGVLTYAKGSPYGADARSVVMVKVENGNWVYRP